MRDAATVIAEVERYGGRLRLRNGRLQLQQPPTKLPPNLRQALFDRGEAIIRALTELDEAPSETSVTSVTSVSPDPMSEVTDLTDVSEVCDESLNQLPPEEVERLDLTRDPRWRDLPTDCHLWVHVLTRIYDAHGRDCDLLHALRILRELGARLRWTGRGFCILPGAELGDEWPSLRAEWLVPYRDILTQVLREIPPLDLFTRTSFEGDEIHPEMHNLGPKSG